MCVFLSIIPGTLEGGLSRIDLAEVPILPRAELLWREIQLVVGSALSVSACSKEYDDRRPLE